MVKNEKILTKDDAISDFRFGILQNLKDNVYKYMGETGITVHELSEKSDVPFSTICTLLYRKNAGCRLYTAVAIAKAMGVSIDELLDAGTIPKTTLENIKLCRGLPTSAIYSIRWNIKHQVAIYNQESKNKNKYISVMCPSHTNDELLKVNNTYKKLDISNLENGLKAKIFLGIHLASDLYMPFYTPYDILLIANDRKPMSTEDIILCVDDTIFIAKQKYEIDHYNYYGIRDGKFKCTENDIDYVIGYITKIIKVDEYF